MKKAFSLAFAFLLVISLFGCSQEPVAEPDPPEPPENDPIIELPKSKFDVADYYHAEYEQRYEDYAELTGYDPLTVVLYVNIGIDRPFYEGYTEVTDTTAVPLLVNKFYKLADDYVPENLVDVEAEYRIQYTQMDGEAYEHFKSMLLDAAAQGFSIKAVSGYRSIETQRAIYNNYLASDTQASVDTYSARAGHSEHNTGRAMDVCGSFGSYLDFGSTPESGWVMENAYNYGFIIRYKTATEFITGYMNEPWHLTYVGVDVATAMKNNGIESLEEYMVKYLHY